MNLFVHKILAKEIARLVSLHFRSKKPVPVITIRNTL